MILLLCPQAELGGGLQGQASVQEVLHHAGHTLPLQLCGHGTAKGVSF
jgi:hypothetical protein